MSKHSENETNKQQEIAEFIRTTYFARCNFHNRFVAECGRCIAETEGILKEERNG